jgi:hypothetical protein
VDRVLGGGRGDSEGGWSRTRRAGGPFVFHCWKHLLQSGGVGVTGGAHKVRTPEREQLCRSACVPSPRSPIVTRQTTTMCFKRLGCPLWSVLYDSHPSRSPASAAARSCHSLPRAYTRFHPAYSMSNITQWDNEYGMMLSLVEKCALDHAYKHLLLLLAQPARIVAAGSDHTSHKTTQRTHDPILHDAP